MSPLRTLRQLVVPTGRHRGPRAGTVPERIEVPLDDLIGPRSWYTTPTVTDVPSCGVLTQAWKPCSGLCDGEMPSVLHEDGSYTCGHCLTTTRPEGES